MQGRCNGGGTVVIPLSPLPPIDAIVLLSLVSGPGQLTSDAYAGVEAKEARDQGGYRDVCNNVIGDRDECDERRPTCDARTCQCHHRPEAREQEERGARVVMRIVPASNKDVGPPAF